MNNATMIQRNKNPQKRHHWPLRVLWLFLILQLGTGMLFWFPNIFSLIAPYSMAISHFHKLFGLLFIGTSFYSFYYYGLQKHQAIWPCFWYGFSWGNADNRWQPGKRVMRFCLFILGVSGIFLASSSLLPRSLLTVFMYLHASGAFVFLLFLLIFIISYGLTQCFRSWTKLGAEKKIIPESAPDINNYKLEVFYPENNNKTKLFFETFALILKHSKIKLLFDDALFMDKYQDIFADPDFISDKEGILDRYSAADCLISIYHKYFTLAGWLQGWFYPHRSLTDLHIDTLAKVFFRYTPCVHCSDFTPNSLNHILFTWYGKFILGEMGYIPCGSNAKARQVRDIYAGDSAYQNTLINLQKKIENLTHQKLTIPLDKPESEIVLVPAIHDYAGQTDTFLGLTIALQAMKKNWTLGKVFFDGFNYGSFYGDWFADKILENLRNKARQLHARQIILGGCSGISLINDTENLVSGNLFIIDAFKNGELKLKRTMQTKVIGFANYCVHGCYLSEAENTRAILQATGCTIEELGPTGNNKKIDEKDLRQQIIDKKITIIVAPFHNARANLTLVVKKNMPEVTVYGLYELLAKMILFDGD